MRAAPRYRFLNQAQPSLAKWSFVAFLLFGPFACDRSEPADIDDSSRKGSGGAPAVSTPVIQPDTPDPEEAKHLERVLAAPGMPGAPKFEQHRATILVRSKGEPVVFERTPQHKPGEGSAKHYAHQLFNTSYSWDVLERLLPTLAQSPATARAVLLHEGYLYAEDPALAYALISQVAVHHLFREERVWIHRGENVVHAERRKGRYYYADGPHVAKPVKLLLLDRVGVGELPEPLHLDVRSLRYRTFFDELKVRHITSDNVVAALRYDDVWVTTVLKRSGARLDVFEQEIPQGAQDRLQQLKGDAERRFRAISVLQRVILEQVDEGLPFDEPLTEIGQQDGRLRPSWVQVYLEGRDSFRFQGDRYPVFDRQGRPLTPQVCADFLLDTFQRMSGTHWRPKGEPPEQIVGRLNLESERGQLRRTVGLVKFFERHPDWFSVRTIPPGKQIFMGEKSRFFQWVVDHARDFAPGDLVLIRGKTPWDEKEEHTHSFFVLDTDPITGVPLAIAGNAWRPSIWSLETEARRTPRRSVRHLVRPQLAWLEQVVDPKLKKPPVPPPLAVEGSNRPGW